jgi:glycosyltransferase involved in cell wall biosynthesis
MAEMRLGTKNGASKVVLVVAPSLRGGGAERVVTHLLRHLDRAKFRPMLALGRAVGELMADVPDDVSIHELHATRSRGAVVPLLRLVRNVQPDVVLATCINFAAALAEPLFPRKTALVLREGNTTSAFIADVARRNRSLALFYKLIYGPLYSFADRIICQSRVMLEDLRDNFGMPAEKLVAILNPIDVDRTRELSWAPGERFNGPGPHLMTVGMLRWSKGFDLLVPAFGRVREHFPTATLTVLGDGPLRGELERLSPPGGSVRFVGFEPNPYAFMRQADLFISASRYEGLSNVVLEALACGTPVVATACPSGIGEIIETGRNGWLAPPNSEVALADTMVAALRALSTIDRVAIATVARERFAARTIAAAYEQEFERAMMDRARL